MKTANFMRSFKAVDGLDDKTVYSIIKERWDNFLEYIQSNTTSTEFANWFSDLSLDLNKCIVNHIFIKAPYVWHEDHIKDNYKDELNRFLNPESLAMFKVSIYADAEYTKSVEALVKPQKQRILKIPPNFRTLQTVNKKYSFISFIAGAESADAKNTLQSLCNAQPNGLMFVTICAGHGFGKTHLLQALANTIDQTKMIYRFITAHDLINFIDEDQPQLTLLKKHVALIDFLIIDDFQRLKERHSELFCDIIDYLSVINKNITFILGSSLPIEELNLSKRLKSRILYDTPCTIHTPSQLSISKIMKHKMKECNIVVDNKHIDLLCKLCSGDVRQIIGQIKFLKFTSLPIDEAIQTLASRTNCSDHTSKINVKKCKLDSSIIMEEVAKHYGISITKMLTASTHSTSHARAIAMYLDSEINPRKTTKEIGKTFERSHSTVVKARQSINALVDSSPQIISVLSKIKKLLYRKTM